VSSLRRRLLAAGAVGVVVAAASAAWLLGAAFERSALRAFDRRLGDDLDTLVALAERGSDGRMGLFREPADERYDRIFSGWYWGVSGAGATRASRSAWDEAALDATLAASTAERRFTDVAGPRGQQLRVASQRVVFSGSGDALAFAAAGDLGPLRLEVREFQWLAGLAVAAIAVALLLAMGVQVTFGLRPLRGVRATLERVRAGDEARFDAQGLPTEIAPLASEVNALLDDHARRVQRARHAAQDLAHALKTPLSALVLESAAHETAFAMRVAAHAARMQAVIERQLAGSLGADTRQRAPLREVLESLARVMAQVHGGRATLDIDVDAGLVFRGRRDDLEEMLGNLLDNACKWAASRVRVRAQARADGFEVSVEDDGPGIDAAAMPSATRRGVRLGERSGGSGIGLAIVEEIAHAYGGVLTLGHSELGGLAATLRFDAAAR
jgi:signal transduction histidine kinase